MPIVEDYLVDRDICMNWATPYKELGSKTLIIAENTGAPFLRENQGVVTHKNSTYTYARWTDKSAAGGGRILSPLTALHYSLCRTQDKLQMKLNNQGHCNLQQGPNKDPFFDIWKQVNIKNYQSLRNFKSSGLGGHQWPRLVAVPTNQVKQFVSSAINKYYAEMK